MKFLKYGPMIRKQKRNNAAIKFQKYIRGYLVHKKIIKKLSKFKITKTSEFFKVIKNGYEISAQILIAYHFRNFLKNKRK